MTTNSKDVRDYLHLYLGSEIYWSESYGSEKLTVEVLHTIDYDDLYSACKPILRPLSSMTEEEKLALFDFVYPNGIGIRRDMSDKLVFIEYALDIQMSDISTHAEKIMSVMTVYQMSKFIKWLLSKCFDLFGLLDSGLAIEKK